MVFSCLLPPAFRTRRGTLQETRYGKSGEDRSSERCGRLPASEIVEAGHNILDAALAQCRRCALKPVGHGMDVTGCLRQFPSQFVSRAVHRATHACHMVDALRLGLVCGLSDLVLDATGHSLQLVSDVRSAFVLAFVFHRSSPVGCTCGHAPGGTPTSKSKPLLVCCVPTVPKFLPDVRGNRVDLPSGGAAKGATSAREGGMARPPGQTLA